MVVQSARQVTECRSTTECWVGGTPSNSWTKLRLAAPDVFVEGIAAPTAVTGRCDWSGRERTREPVGYQSKAASGGCLHLHLSGQQIRWWPVSTGSLAESWNRRLVWLACILVQPRCGCGRRLGKALGAGVSRGPVLTVLGHGRPGRLLGSAVHFLIAAGNRPLALGLLEGFRTRLSLNCDRSRMVSTSKRVSCSWPSRSKARWRRVEERPLQRCSDC